MTEDELFQASLDQAKIALSEKEVAIGCVFYHVELKKVVAENRNTVNATKNATRHAEINCIEDALLFYAKEGLDPEENWPLIDVYVTCEPCIMCARIMRHLKVRNVVYGCSNDRFGGCQSVMKVATFEEISEPKITYRSGVREDEAIKLLKIFYSGENLNAPEEIRKVKKSRMMPSDHDHLR